MIRASTASRRALATIVLAGTVGVVPPLSASAFAQRPIYVPSEPLPSVRVSYADLDLARPTDIDRLRLRARTAAQSVCFDASRSPLTIAARDHACYSIAMARANRDIDQVVQDKISGASVSATLQAIVIHVP